MKLQSTLSLFLPAPVSQDGLSVFSTVVDFLFGAHKPFTQVQDHDVPVNTADETRFPVIQLVPTKPAPQFDFKAPPISFDVDFIQTRKRCYISPMISDADVVLWRKMMAQCVINGTLVSHSRRHEFVRELNELLKKHKL
ncbi:MAG: hypothetical protein LH606_06395 [Cytophagaceae bacterium]|nr:hypothetical protein [Cytophagaceae bacterium]